MRLIDADALIEAMRTDYCADCDRRKGMKNGKERFVYDIGDAPCRVCSIDDAMNDVEYAATIDAAPVVHGRWIGIETVDAYDIAGIKTWALRARCSECGFVKKFIEAHTGQYIYCPTCGAKMDGEVTA